MTHIVKIGIVVPIVLGGGIVAAVAGRRKSTDALMKFVPNSCGPLFRSGSAVGVAERGDKDVFGVGYLSRLGRWPLMR